MSERNEADFLDYGVDEKPPLLPSILLGFQHYLTMIGATVAVPLVLAGALGITGTSEAGRLIGTFFVVSGVATLAQTILGNRYPLVQGATFSMLAPALAIIGVLAAQDAGWQEMLLNLQGAVIVAGITEVLIGYLGVMGWLKKHMSPVTIAPVIALIGLSLFNAPQIVDPNGAAAMGTGQNWWLLGLTLVLIVAFSQYLDRYSRVFRLYPVLLGIAAAWIIAALLSYVGVFGTDAVSYVNLEQLGAAPLVQQVSPLQWGMPEFNIAFSIGMIAGMIASVIESFGDYFAVARMTGSGAPSSKRINHGIGMEGLGNVFAGVMGTGNGSTSYTENIGAIGITGVASRYVVQIGALVMIAAGLFGPLTMLFATIPAPIVGGLYIVMFGQIAAIGLSQLHFVDLQSNRNVFIVGISLFAGLAIPEHMNVLGRAYENTAGELVKDNAAGLFQEGMGGVDFLGQWLGISEVATTIFVIGSTGMIVGGIIAFVLDNTIPGTREERGLKAWDAITEEDHEFQSFFERVMESDR